VCLAAFGERWAAYMLGSSLVLMLCERYGYARGDALRLAGLVSAATYLGILPSGIASDRALGPCRWLGLSMVLLALGYAALTLSAPGALGVSLALLVVGHALFKPTDWLLTGMCRRPLTRCRCCMTSRSSSTVAAAQSSRLTFTGSPERN